MPYLESIRVFVRVIELGSITAAGRDQRLTPAVASNRIKELEARLGVRLLNRTTRRLAPTEIGRIFYDHARRIIEAVDEAEAVVAQHAGRPRGAIRVLAPLGIGRRVIA
ncbi:MAG: LysR family transcriptional regulator, partial [Alphaproteobacteria bacterium]